MEKSNYTRLPVFALGVSKNCVLFVFCGRQRRWCIFFFACGKSRLVHRAKKIQKKREKSLKRVSPPLYYGRVVWAERRMGKRLQKFFSLSFSFYVPFQPLSNNGWYCCTHKKYTHVLVWVPLAKRACQRISIEFPEKKKNKRNPASEA